MPRKGASARARERAGLPPVKPGKVGWVHGTKLAFFSQMKAEYLAAVELDKTGPFYDKATHLYLGVYGYNTPLNGDLEDDADRASDIDSDEDVNELPAEESSKRAKYYKTMRGVRAALGFTGVLAESIPIAENCCVVSRRVRRQRQEKESDTTHLQETIRCS